MRCLISNPHGKALWEHRNMQDMAPVPKDHQKYAHMYQTMKYKAMCAGDTQDEEEIKSLINVQVKKVSYHAVRGKIS